MTWWGNLTFSLVCFCFFASVCVNFSMYHISKNKIGGGLEMRLNDFSLHIDIRNVHILPSASPPPPSPPTLSIHPLHPPPTIFTHPLHPPSPPAGLLLLDSHHIRCVASHCDWAELWPRWDDSRSLCHPLFRSAEYLLKKGEQRRRASFPHPTTQ